MEVTSALHEQAGAAFSDADRKIAERAEQTSAALLARAEDIARTFEEADRRLAARAEERPVRLLARASPCDRAHTSSALLARHADARRTRCCARAEAKRPISWPPVPARSPAHSTRPTRTGRPRSRDGAVAGRTAQATSCAISKAPTSGLRMRIGESAEALAARASDLGRIFDAADQQLISRIAEGSEALSARAIRDRPHLRRGRSAAGVAHRRTAPRRSASMPRTSSAPFQHRAEGCRTRTPRPVRNSPFTPARSNRLWPAPMSGSPRVQLLRPPVSRSRSQASKTASPTPPRRWARSSTSRCRAPRLNWFRAPM